MPLIILDPWQKTTVAESVYIRWIDPGLAAVCHASLVGDSSQVLAGPPEAIWGWSGPAVGGEVMDDWDSLCSPILRAEVT